MRKDVIITAVLVLLVGIGSFYAGRRSVSEEGTVSLTILDEINNRVILMENLTFRRGESVLDLLLRVDNIVYASYPFGKYVTSIRGISQTENAWWLYYVNGQLAGVSCDRFMLVDGDNVTWKYTNQMPF